MSDFNDLNGDSSYSRVKEYRSRFEATPSTSFTTQESHTPKVSIVKHALISTQPSTSREKERKRVRALPWRHYISSLEGRTGERERPDPLRLLHEYNKAQDNYRKAKTLSRAKELWADPKQQIDDWERNWPLMESRLLETEGPGYARTYLMLKDSDRGIICKQRVNGVCESAPDCSVREVRDPRSGTRDPRIATRNISLMVPEYEIDDTMIGAPSRREVTIIDLNDNVQEDYLRSICSGRGERDVQYLHIYTNPKSQRHLGMALVEFGTSADAFSFVEQYSKTPIMGFPVKVFIDTLGFWVLDQYRRLTGLDPERPPRYANLTSNAAVHMIRFAVRKANYRDGVFDNTDTSQFVPQRAPIVHGPHTPAASPPSRDSMDDNDSQYESRRFAKPKGAHTPVEPEPSTSSNSRISSRAVSPEPHTNGRHRSEEHRADSGNSSHKHSHSHSRSHSRHRSRSHSSSTSTTSNRRRRRHRRSRSRTRSRSPSYRHGHDRYSYRRHGGGGRGFRGRHGGKSGHFRQSFLRRDLSPLRNGDGHSERRYSSNGSSRTSSAIGNHRLRHESKGSDPKAGEEMMTVKMAPKESKDREVANRFVMTLMKQIRRSPQVLPPPVPPAPTPPTVNGFAADLMLQPPPPPTDIKIPSPVETPQPPPPEPADLPDSSTHSARNHHSERRHNNHGKHRRRFSTPPRPRTPPFDLVVQEFLVQEDQLPKMQLNEVERRIAVFRPSPTPEYLKEILSYSYCRRNAQTGEAIFHVPRLYLTEAVGYYTAPVTYVIPEPTAVSMDSRLENYAEACDRLQTDMQLSLFSQSTQAINVEMFEELDRLHNVQEEQQRKQMTDASRRREPQRMAFDFEAQFGGNSMFGAQPVRMDRSALTRRIPKKASATTKSKSTSSSKPKRKTSDGTQSTGEENSDEENSEPQVVKRSKRIIESSSEAASSSDDDAKSGSESEAENEGSVYSDKSLEPVFCPVQPAFRPVERSMSPDTRALVSSDRVVRKVDYNEDNTSDSEQASDWAEDEGVRVEEPKKTKTTKKRHRSVEADENRKVAKPPPAKKKRRQAKVERPSPSTSPLLTRPPSAVAAFNFLDANDFDSATPTDATPDGEASNPSSTTPDDSSPPVAATTLDEAMETSAVRREPASPTPATLRLPERETTAAPAVEAALPIPTKAEPPATPPISRAEKELQLHRQRFCIPEHSQSRKEFPALPAGQQDKILSDVADEEDATYLTIALRRYEIEVERKEATGGANRLTMRHWNPFKMNPDPLKFPLPQKPSKAPKNNRRRPKKSNKANNGPNVHDLPINPEGCARCHVYKTEEKQYDKIIRNDGRIEVSKRDEQMARNRQLKTRELKNLHRGLTTMINQFQYRQKMLKFARSAIHGWGLFTLEDIQANDMIIEYVGEIVSSVVADVRECNYTKRGMGSSYLFRVNEDKVIDATRKGSVARFINHSCNPNSYAKVVGRQEDRICIYAKRAISKGEEITYDYKFALEEDKINCYCGADNCRRYLN